MRLKNQRTSVIVGNMPPCEKIGLNYFKANGLFSCENKPFLRPFLVEISGIEPLTS